MKLDAYGWPALTDAQMAKRRRWLARPGVLWGQTNWLACKLELPVGPPRRLTQKEYRDEENDLWQPDDEDQAP